MADFRPGKPSWVLGQSAAQVIAGGAAANLEWDIIEWEDPDVFDGLDTITVDRPGLYWIGGQVTRAAVASSSPIVARIRRNGSTTVLHQGIASANAYTAPVAQLCKLAAGDQVVMNVTLHATLSASTSPASTEFWGARIGPERWT